MSASFEDFNFNKQLYSAIADAAYETPTPVQEKVIPSIMAGHDVIGIAQTGTGKTAAYLLPTLMKVKYLQGMNPRVLVLAPTRELCIQIAEHAVNLGKYTDLRFIALYGGTGTKAQIQALEKGSDVMIATPGRFMDLYLAGHFHAKEIRTLIIDEADKMLDMGFVPQIRKILEVIPRKRQNLLFSATFSARVEKLTAEFLEFPMKIEVSPQATPVETVSQQVYPVPNYATKINLLDYILETEKLEKVIIFVRTKKVANELYNNLNKKHKGKIKVIHGNKDQNTRINAVESFKNSETSILVATDVVARGIDISDVSHVINFEIPVVPEDYIHRIGRTGRALKSGTSISFCNEAEKFLIAKIEELIKMKIPYLDLPLDVDKEKTSFTESQGMKLEIDNQKKRLDPTFKGGFHDKKGRVKYGKY